MKVPEYRSQTPLSTNRGAQMLSVQANPSALAQSAVAAQNFGAELSRQSLSIMEQLVGEKRKTELNNAEVMLGEQLASLQLEVEQENPSTVMGDGPRSFKSRANQLASKIALDLDDSVVKRRFKNNSNLTVANNSIRVNANAQKRIYDAAYASEIELAESYKRTIAFGPSASSATEVNQAKLDLFGLNPEGTKVQPSLYENMANRGLISRTDAVKLELEAKQDIQTQEVNATILQATQSNDDSGLQLLMEELLNGKSFPDLSFETSIDLASKALNVALAIDDQKEADEANAIKQAEEELKNTRTRNDNDLIAQAINFQIGGSPINLADVADKVRNGEVSQEIGKYVTRISTEEEPIVEDKGQALLLYKMAQDAETEDDIDAIRKKIILLTDKKEIKLETLQAVLRITDLARNSLKNSESASKKADLINYRNFLNLYYRRTEEGDLNINLPFATDIEEADDSRYLDAVITYYELVNNGDMTPKAAYELVIDQTKASEVRALGFLGLPQEFMDRYFPIIEGKEGDPRNFVLTAPSIQQAQEALMQNKNINQLQKMFDLETIETLRSNYMNTLKTGVE